MRRNQLGIAVLAIAGLLSLAGCYSMTPHPYGAAPYRPAPTMYAPGVPGYPQAAPRATYILPGDPVRSAPGTVITRPQPTYQPGTPAPAPGSAPRATAPASGEKPVPLPREPEANGANSTIPNRQSSQLEFEDSESPTIARRSGFALADVDPDGKFYRPRVSDTRSTSPARSASSPRLQPIVRENEDGISQVGHQSPSAHHPSFRWIQGVLQYDAKHRSWHLMFDSNPSDDPSGGEVKLTGNLGFTPADHNQLVRVYGDFHRELLDRLGKPQYVVTKVEPLTTGEFKN